MDLSIGFVTGLDGPLRCPPSAPKCRIMSALRRRQRMNWHPDAQAALKKDVPFFVRPAVRKRVEAMAAEAGLALIELDFYAEAKASMAPK